MNRPPKTATAFQNGATWLCVCGNPTALHNRSGLSAGPTPDSVVTCPQCGRVYFVIPQDRSHGPAIEVVELFGMPPPAASAVPDAPAPTARPPS